jgi:hypothetical protein
MHSISTNILFCTLCAVCSNVTVIVTIINPRCSFVFEGPLQDIEVGQQDVFANFCILKSAAFAKNHSLLKS